MSKEKIRKVDLSGLPRWTEGAYIGKIKWRACEGYKIPFVYDEIEAEILITKNIDEDYVEIIYNNNTYKIGKESIKNGNLGKVVGKYTKNFRYNIGEVINGLEITNRYNIKQTRKDGRIEVRKRYNYKCIKCGNEDTMDEHNLRKGYGCNVCCTYKAKVMIGFNDVATTAPWMIEHFVDKEDAKRYTKRSDKKAKFKCLECGEEKEVSISNMYRDRRVKCSRCGDGFKYPEKFMYSLLKQLEIEFIYQPSSTTFSWCDKYRYDFYIPSLNIIIETHGIQHYEENKNWTMSLKEVQENDKLKEELAVSNGIDNYIVIDCRYSELEWIKNSILNSKLNEEFDLSKVDWESIEEIATKSLIKAVCLVKKKDNYIPNIELAKMFNLDRSTILNYLKKGVSLGWCEYSGNEEKIRSTNKKKKKVAVFKNNEFLYESDSVAELSKQSKELFGIEFTKGGISSVCLGKIKSHRGYTFKYM